MRALLSSASCLVLVASSASCESAETAGYDAAIPTRCTEPVMALRGRCGSATVECLVACAREDVACQSACLDADPDPAGCTQCLDVNELACYLDEGCVRQWDALTCCPAYATCVSSADFAACVESSCAREWELFRGCSSFVDPATCEPIVRACFSE